VFASTRTGRLVAAIGTVLLCFTVAAVMAQKPLDTSVPLTPAERAWLVAHPVIRLAPDPDFPPIEFIDASGKYQGIAADYAALMEHKLGIKFTVVPLNSWDEVLEKARSGEIDMLGAASESPQRAKYMTFTKPHIELPGVIIVRNDTSGSIKLDDLHGKKIAVVSGYIWQDLILNDYPDFELVRVADLKEGLQDVSFGRVDAMVANLATASWYIEREAITNLRVGGESGYFGRYAFATRKDWPELNSILQKALAGITAQEHHQILQRWVHLRPAPSPLSRTTLAIFAVVVVLLLTGAIAILAWNRSLKTQVKQRTLALEQQLEQRRTIEASLEQARIELEQRVIDRTSRLEESNQRLRQEINTRERIQEDLRRFKMTLDETLDCVFMFDARTLQFFYVNQGAVDQVGYSHDEMLEMHPYDIKPEFTEQQFRDFIAPFVEKQQASLTFETVHQHKNGSRIPVEIFLQYVAPENESARFVAIVRDVSDRKRIESQLNWNNRQIDIINRAQSAFISNSDPRAAFEMLLSGVLELSDSEYGFIGEVFYTEDGMPYLRTYAISNIAWDEATRNFYKEHAPQGMKFYNLDTLFGAALKSGEIVIANDPKNDSRSGGLPPGHPPLDTFLGIPLYASERMVGLVGVANRADGYNDRLVTSLTPFTNTCASLIGEHQFEQLRIAAEERIKQNEERMRAVLGNVLESIITTDPSGIIESVNHSTEVIFGYTEEEMVGKNVKMLMPEPDRSAHDQYLKTYHTTRKARILSKERELEGRRKDGTHFPLELSVMEISVGGRSSYVGVARDITERRQSNAALEHARSELQRANEKLRQQAQTDGLTGIANRRHFDAILDQELRRAKRAGDTHLSLMLCDIDSFKLYNDGYGHLAGDTCLQEISAVLSSTLNRADDLVARYGGEEFAIILPVTDAAGARSIAARLQQAVCDRNLPHKGSLIADRITLSIGVATLNPGEHVAAQKFIAMADSALYLAKKNGRNRVEQYSESARQFEELEITE
jgi:diguanylate cyclase (GGDEF)-like protein/PAS domain S-box-containing protein